MDPHPASRRVLIAAVVAALPLTGLALPAPGAPIRAGSALVAAAPVPVRPGAPAGARSVPAAPGPQATPVPWDQDVDDPRPRPAIQNDGAFGFRVGEERRYVLGPPESLWRGESARWSIRLEQVDRVGDETTATFVLTHVRNDVLADFFNQSRMMNVRIEARLEVNRHGFPVSMVMEEQEDVSGETGSLSDVRTTTYTFTGDAFEKSVRLGERDWSFRVPVASQEHVDLEVPEGLFLFWPSPLACLGGVSGDVSRGCSSMEPAFTNPGLLSLVMPWLLEEETPEREFLFFTARGVGTRPAGLMNMRRWVSRERSGIGHLSNSYEHASLKLEEYGPVEVGDRTVDAYRVDVSGAPREIWVDTDGTVLRMELDPHPRTMARRWIRLLWPSEY